MFIHKRLYWKSALLCILGQTSICEVFDVNKKSEHTSHCEVVRIFRVWWRLLDSNQWPPACEWASSLHDFAHSSPKPEIPSVFKHLQLQQCDKNIKSVLLLVSKYRIAYRDSNVKYQASVLQLFIQKEAGSKEDPNIFLQLWIVWKSLLLSSRVPAPPIFIQRPLRSH